MATKGWKRTAFPVPQTDEQASEFLGQIGRLDRQIALEQRRLTEKVSKLQEEAASKVAPLRRELEETVDGLHSYVESHRERLTNKGKTKTVSFATGTVHWRLTPPAVTLTKVKDVLVRLKELGLKRFIRIKEEPNKEAMLQEPEVAAGVLGIKITQREEFVVKPNVLEVEVVKRLPTRKRTSP